MMPLTRSMVHGMRSAAMNLARSLDFFVKKERKKKMTSEF